ncbi:Glycine betaine transport system permease protein OpuAB [Anaerohalosphaera lusitana]|uniref:Glycine betaine transport system permease protein OpuAB n=1 Tax=Anaerohalosphaera lusitana TaxID=1936003 RepID=A0A1U9NIV3_9BACT|nr:ABC transporter permease subunit [Anaerohalosphaera lusitana]AQT67859.1 Glycine betaine transport system permease protein OpuAB [Anaerohalosphaera lusitana]
MTDFQIPRFPLGDYIDNGLEWLNRAISQETSATADFVNSLVMSIVDFLTFFPPVVLMLLITALAFWIKRSVKFSIFTFLGLYLLYNFNLWEPTMQTLALVVISTLVAISLGMPLGVLAALSKHAKSAIWPVLDFMQTLPPFVYLIPAIPFFGLGYTSAMFSTVIFAMPPAIRMTTLGIEQVPSELSEAADSFGSTRMQKLIKLQLPLAAPSIRAGINQTILLSLSMVVIAAMIGAKGLGGRVWEAIQRLEPGKGFEAGIGIVIVAIILDRLVGHVKKKQAA